MHSVRKIAIAGTVLALALSTTQSATADPRSNRAATARAQAGVAQSVTLLSGDKVIVSGSKPEQSTIAVRAGAGREKMAFASHIAGGHLYVIPSDATRLVASGRLDRRLFDVTLLIESGYDDAHRGNLPVIITYDGAAPANLAIAGTTATRPLPSINGTALNADKGNAGQLWSSISGTARLAGSGIRKVWLDGRRKASLDHSVPQIGAPAAWAAGFTGTGVKIAVLDSGVDQTHPDLATQEVAEQNFSDAADNVDRLGHGTHVASTAAGTGAKAAGQFKGVAFGAQVLDGKVLNDFGFGQDSWIIAGLQWAAEQGAKVANLSLGGGDTPDIDPLEEAVNTLSAQFGILYVIAAGNSGRPGTISSPGSADSALTVGAVDRSDNIAPFSSRGPRTGDGAVKPDITAPGVEIVAAKAADGIIGTPAVDGYVSLSGTSMATPHVAGAAGLLAQQHPSWTGKEIKAALTASAKPNPTLSAFDQGSGRVDVAKAITQTITTEPTNVSLGTALWPHDDDQPVTKPLTYHNSGSADVTLDLAVNATGPDGRPAPNGVFALSANQITVPAGGQAQVSFTGNPRAGTLDGAYSGSIVATSGGSSAITPFAITREVESYNLTINVRDLDGAPTPDYSVAVIGYDDDTIQFPYDPDGTFTARLPKGRYFVDSTVASGTGPAPHLSQVEHPNTTLNRDVTLDAQASAAKPIKVSTPDPTATLLFADFGFDVRTAHTRFIKLVVVSDLGQLSVGQLGPSAPVEALTTRVNTHWTAPSGAFYGLAWFERGTVPTGFTKEVKQTDLATLEADLGSVTQKGGAGLRLARPRSAADPTSFALGALRDVPLSSRQTEFYNTDGTQWSTGLVELNAETGDFLTQHISEFLDLEAGQTRRVRFNHALFGPAFPETTFPWALRFGDIIDVFVPLFSDSSGNAGFSTVESASTKLFRGGVLVGEFPGAGSGFFQVPPEVSDYRLTTEAVRPGIFDVTTRISAAWTFRSGHVDGTDPAALPLSAVRFSPKLDDNNSARAGRSFLIPVALQLQSGATIRPPRISVEVSYDEGTTWRQAAVVGNQLVLLFHPTNATSVSLRAKATDRDGNTVEQTIIRAYKLSK